MYMRVVHSVCGCSQPYYLKSYDRRRPQKADIRRFPKKAIRVEIQPSPTSVHARESVKEGLCERREEFNEVRGERWSATTSANAYVNASLKSLLGAHSQLGGPWATKIFFGK